MLVVKRCARFTVPLPDMGFLFYERQFSMGVKSKIAISEY